MNDFSRKENECELVACQVIIMVFSSGGCVPGHQDDMERERERTGRERGAITEFDGRELKGVQL